MMSMQDLWEGRLKTSEYDVPAEDTATLSAAGENLLYDSAESCFQTHDMCVCQGRGNHKLQRLSSAGFIAHEATPVETIPATRAPFWLVGPFSQIQSPVARNVES